MPVMWSAALCSGPSAVARPTLKATYGAAPALSPLAARAAVVGGRGVASARLLHHPARRANHHRGTVHTCARLENPIDVVPEGTNSEPAPEPAAAATNTSAFSVSNDGVVKPPADRGEVTMNAKAVEVTHELIPELNNGQPMKWPGQRSESVVERQVATIAETMPDMVKDVGSRVTEVVTEENLELALGVADRIMELAGQTARRTGQAIKDGTDRTLHTSIEAALSLIFGAEAKVDRYTVYTRGGVLLRGVTVGQNISMDKIMLRVHNLPMLAATMQSWKGKERQGQPLHMESVRIQGMQVHNLRGSSVKALHRVFTQFPSTLSIHKLVFINTNLALAPTGWGDSSYGRTVSHPGITLHRAEWSDVWNTMSGSMMFARFTDLVEPLSASYGTTRSATPRRLSLDPAADALVQNATDALYEWRDSWRREKVQAAYEGVAKVVNRMPMPVPEANRPKLMEWEAVMKIGDTLVDEVPSLARAAIAGLGLKGPDLSTAMTLVQQGVPMHMLENNGDLLVRFINTGVADAVLERPQLISGMVESGTLDPLIKQGVLAKALDSPDVVIELIQQGVMDDLVETGTFKELLEQKNTQILDKLLKGMLLSELTYARVLADLFNHHL